MLPKVTKESGQPSGNPPVETCERMAEGLVTAAKNHNWLKSMHADPHTHMFFGCTTSPVLQGGGVQEWMSRMISAQSG